jgi:hypothetical protein
MRIGWASNNEDECLWRWQRIIPHPGNPVRGIIFKAKPIVS